MRKHHQFLKLLFLALILSALSSVPVIWAQSESRLDITGVDASAFPIVQFTIIAADDTSSRQPDLAGLNLSENGTPVTDFLVTEVPVGTELIFVIDANSTINDQDEAGGLMRRDKVRESILRYANEFMDDTQLDRASIIIPAEDGAQLLLDRGMFPTGVINEVNFYEPAPLDSTPLNEMLLMALDHAAQGNEEGRFQAILLFTDGAELDQQLDYLALTERAQAINIPIFSAILGARADDDEIENVAGLTEPTGGSYLHMPNPEDGDPIFSLVQAHRPQFQVQYRSLTATNGPNKIVVDLAGSQAEAEISVELEPPAAEIVVDNTRPIRRVVPNPDAPITAAEPASQPIVTHISWPDGHPRTLGDAILFVNGSPQPPVAAPNLSADGLITLDWEISDLDEGTYELFVKVTDELGLQGQSRPLPMTILVEGLVVEEPVGSDVESTTVEEEEPSESSQGIMENLGIVGLILGFLALFAGVIILILAVLFVRRRRTADPAAPAPTTTETQPVTPMDHLSTQVIKPAFVNQGTTQAYLEPLENAPDHSGDIQITESNITIGRDPKLAKIVFADKSVSRLHARILEANGVYQLYDEGSASGTYINFKQISLKPQPLNDNDEIHIGQVHLRFHVTMVADESDATQIMPSPMRPAAGEPPAAVDEDLSTQPYIPGQPAGAPPQDSPQTSDDDEDDISTQPYMPHAPRR